MSLRLDRTELQKNQKMSRANIEALVQTEQSASDAESSASSLEGKVGQAISGLSRLQQEVEENRQYAYLA